MNGLDLKVKRVRAGLTLWQLGRLAGVHPALLSEMETGKRPLSDVVAEALDRELAKVGLEVSND